MQKDPKLFVTASHCENLVLKLLFGGSSEYLPLVGKMSLEENRLKKNF